MSDNNSSSQKETEFNSSIATLKRIDVLMSWLHGSAVGLFDGRDNVMIYIDTLPRLLLEGRSKFTASEMKSCSAAEERLDSIKQKYGYHLYMNTISGRDNFDRKQNCLFYEGRRELMTAAKDFERLIVGCLDAHGMLLTNVKDAMTKFRGSKQ